MKAVIITASLVSFYTTFSNPAFATSYHVPMDYPTIQECIDASMTGDTCLVAPGTYVENINFLGKAITVRSDVDGDSQTEDISAEDTIVDGNQAGSVVTFNFWETLESTLYGFTIQNGEFCGVGGGISCHLSSPTIKHCTITGNSVQCSGSNGGGIGCYSSSPIITDCTILGNSA